MLFDFKIRKNTEKRIKVDYCHEQTALNTATKRQNIHFIFKNSTFGAK